MEKLNLNSGVKEYMINEKCSVFFNPTDCNFLKELYNAFDDLDKKQEEHKAEMKKVSDVRQALQMASVKDAEMREVIDGILGDGVCAALFGSMNVYALADGLPVWANLMLAIIDEMDDSIKAEQKKTSPRVAKYTARYKR